MSLRFLSLATVACLPFGFTVFESTQGALGQSPRRRAPTAAEVANRLPAKTAETAKNEVILPIPLTARRLEAAREAVNKEIRDQTEELKANVKPLFPDEIDALSGTGNWSPEHRNALTKALKSIDPTAVYEAWLVAEPSNTTGAERISRQAAVQRAFNVLEQHARKDEAEPKQVADLADELGKLAKIQPLEADVTDNLQILETWIEVRQMLQVTKPETAGVAKLPTGTVRLVYNPSMDFGTAIVLDDNIVMVGNRGRGGVKIGKGNAAEALGLSVIAGDPVDDAEGQPVRGGALLINPKKSGATVRYVVNGDAYVMEPGMSQALPSGTRWVVAFDRGGSVGSAKYTLAEGTYQFAPTDDGWDLYQRRFDVTIDNARNPKDFHFVLDTQRLVVRAGQTKTISSKYPIMLQYDRGNSTKVASKKLNFSGTVEVAINEADNLWDLFPEEGNKKKVVGTTVIE
ncbi:MAG TPA: hypothetical protein VND64_03945 [Pirellulales bacterium]|nr:hypothetical protein [Pirellulales bacterium]